MTVKLPLVLSPALGARLPAASAPLAAADQEPDALPELKVQVKSCDAPADNVTLLGVKLAQAPPPATLIFEIVLSPVFLSVTTTVIIVFASTVVPGDTLLAVSVVAG